MPRSTRSLLFAGVAVGATALVGVGLAAADEDATTNPLEAKTAVVDSADVGTSPTVTDDDTEVDDDSTAEDPSTLTADEDESGDIEVEGGAPEDTHGAAVSALAQETEPGPDHGAIVSDFARQNGDETSAEARDDDATDEQEVAETDDESEVEETEKADDDRPETDETEESDEAAARS